MIAYTIFLCVDVCSLGSNPEPFQINPSKVHPRFYPSAQLVFFPLLQQIKLNHVLLGYLQDSFTYSMFEKLTTTFIKSVVPEHQQSVRNREQIAWTFEVTSRLKALDLQPMNRVMGFGAKYVMDHFTPWVQGHGGWVRVNALILVVLNV